MRSGQARNQRQRRRQRNYSAKAYFASHAKVFEYIKEHNLQDPANKKEIVCDENLKSIFAGRERVGFLEVAKLMNPHFIKNE